MLNIKKELQVNGLNMYCHEFFVGWQMEYNIVVKGKQVKLRKNLRRKMQ